MTTRLLLCLLLLSGCGETPALDPYQVPTTSIDTEELKSASATNLGAQMLDGRNQWYGCDEKLPIFKGGHDSLVAFLNRHVQWPDSLPQSVRGKIFVRFTIDERGGIRNARIVQSLHPLADAEALRLAGLLNGHFTPDRHDGRAVSSETTLPLTFIGVDAVPMKQNK